MELKLSLINNDVHAYMQNLAKMQQHLATVNADAYSDGIRGLIKQHKVKRAVSPPSDVPIVPQDMEIAWSDLLATTLISRHVTEGALFELFDSQQAAMDSVAQMSMPTHVIAQHLNSLQRFISTILV